MNAMTFAPKPAFTGRVARNRVRARLGTARHTAPVRTKSRSAELPDNTTRFMPIGERRFLMRILETLATEHRGKGGTAPLTASALHVARTMLFQLMDRHSGRLEHAYTWIARHSRRAYQTACSAVAQLETLGVLVVQRRCRRGAGEGAPPWVQDTNLYRFEIPAKLRSYWSAREAGLDARARARAAAKGPEDATHLDEAARAANVAAESSWNQYRLDLAVAEGKAEATRLEAALAWLGISVETRGRRPTAKRGGPS